MPSVTFVRFPRTPLSLISLAASLCFGGPVNAEVYDDVQVVGAELIPADDIRKTCGELTGVFLDDRELQAVEECLMSTGVFEAVSVTGKGDLLVIDVTEVELRPGRIDVGLGWVNDQGLTGTISYEQYNLLPDTFGAVHGDFSRESKSYDVNLFRAETFGPELGLGFDLSGQESDFEDLAFSGRNHQGNVYLSWTPTPEFRIEYGLGYRDHSLTNLDDGASALLRSEVGRINAPFARAGLSYRSAEKDGQSQVSIRVEQFLWNLGTDDPISETQLEVGSRYPMGERTSLMLGLRGSVVTGLAGNDTTALDRNFAGGDTFRGFAPRGVAPSDQGDLLGGNRFLVASLELQRDLGEFLGRNFSGGIFADVGSVWGLDNTLDGRIDDSKKIRSSVGVSLSFDVGDTPVSLYAAAPVDRQADDRVQYFGLEVSANF